MEKEICSLEIVIDGTSYHYEAHSFQRVAEILAGQLRVLESGDKDAFGSPIYSKPIQSFTIHRFK